MGPMASLVAALLWINGHPGLASDVRSDPNTTAARCSATSTTPRALGGADLQDPTTRATCACHYSDVEHYGTTYGISEHFQEGGSPTAVGRHRGEGKVFGSEVGAITTMPSCKDQAWGQQQDELVQVSGLQARSVDATDTNLRDGSLEHGHGLHAPRLHQADDSDAHQQGESGRTRTRESWSQVQEPSYPVSSPTRGSTRNHSHWQRDGGLNRDLGGLGCGDDKSTVGSDLRPLSWGHAAALPPSTDPLPLLGMQQLEMHAIPREQTGCGAGSGSLHLLRVSGRRDDADQHHKQSRRDSVGVSELRTGSLHVRTATGVLSDGEVQSGPVDDAVKSCWLQEVSKHYELDETFDQIVETLDVDWNHTYVTIGYGEGVKGVMPVVTKPIISRRIILTKCGDVPWCAVDVTTVPSTDYHFGCEVNYLVLYEFMAEFLDYMVDTEFEHETTLPRSSKVELSKQLDEMVGDLTVYWTLWESHYEPDDIVEAFGNFQDKNDTVVEIYSPPRVVEAAAARGLRADLSIDLTTGYDLNNGQVRQQVREEVRKRKPRLLVTTPPCTKFSLLQNLRRYPERLDDELKEAINHVDFSMELQEDQIDRGDHGLHEHPETATSWQLPKVINYISREEVILIKSHLCRFGLVINGRLSRKATLFATSCDAIAVNLQKLCECVEPHQQLISGLPKLAQVYPPQLVNAIIDGLLQDWVDQQKGRSQKLPDLGDLEQWIDELPPRQLQDWRSFHDSAILVIRKPSSLPMSGPGHRCLRWTWVKNPVDGKWIQFEQGQKGKVRKLEVKYEFAVVLYHHPEINMIFSESGGTPITFGEKNMVLRAHINLGHPPVKEFVRLLKAAGTRNDIINYVLREFHCEGCLKERRQPTRLPASTPRTYDFNVVIGVDILFVHGASPLEEHPVLNITCVGTLYSTFTMVHPTRRASALVWAAFLQCWLRVFGAPSFIIMDQGLEFQGDFIDGLESHGIQPILIDRDAPYQNGVTERRGGLFKEVYYRTRELYQPSDVSEVQNMIHEVAWALQTLTNRSGYSPAQRVFGKQPSLAMEILNDSGEYVFPQTSDAAWRRSEDLRKAARQALVDTDSKERLQRSLRARPRRAHGELHFIEGEPVYVWRQGRRGSHAKVGPCFVVLQKGDTVWVTRRGELWKCNKIQVFKMGNLEKQGIEAVPAELLKAKERLRFHSEKLGYVDVAREGDPQDDASTPDQAQQPDQQPLQEIRRRAPRTPRGPPEGSGTRQPSTPLPDVLPLVPDTPPNRPALPPQMSEVAQPMTPGIQRQPPTPGGLEEALDREVDTEHKVLPAPGVSTPPRLSTPPPGKRLKVNNPEQEDSSSTTKAVTIQQPTAADELWKATVESQRSRSTYDPGAAASSSSEALVTKAWSRYDLNAKRYRGSNSKGPLWGDVSRRVTVDLDSNEVIQDIPITEELSLHKIHEKLPEGSENIETILIYRARPGHPDPGQPLTDEIFKGVRPLTGISPGEDARLVELGMKRSLEGPTVSDRATLRSRNFGAWIADDVSEWGDKTKYPVIANARDLLVFKKLINHDCYYENKKHGKMGQINLVYLTKQSGKELDERKLSVGEIKMFREAKRLEIDNLVGSNAIEMITDEAEIQEIRRHRSHRIMPSRFILTKKAGEVGEQWKAKARWILLGHKDPDALELERYAPTPSSTTVMICLQVIASMNFKLYIMDVSSAFGQSDPHEREQGPLYASMPPTGIPEVPQHALVRVLTAVYGLVNAPAVWRKTVRRHLLELGYSESVFDPCLYYLRPNEEEISMVERFVVAGVVLLDVDDFCQGGNQRHEGLMGELRKRLKFGKWRDVYGGTAEYIGRTLKQLENYEIQASMKRYIEEKLRVVTLSKDRLKEKTSLLTETEITWLRGVGGSLLWVGKEGRPDVGAACAMAMSWSSSGPTVEHILMANKTVNELKQTSDVFIRIIPLEPEVSIWMSVADASMANVENKSQGGYIIAYAEKQILKGALARFSINSWRSHRLKRVVKATLGSEALAMDDALAEIEWVRALWHEVLDPSTNVLDGTRLGDEQSVLVMRTPEDREFAESVASVRVKDDTIGAHVTDAKALYDLLHRRSGNAGQDRRAQIDVAVICVSAKALQLTTFWVPGSVMIADPLTKRLGNGTLLRRIMSEATYALMKIPTICESE